MKILTCGCVHGRWDIVCQLIEKHKPTLAIILGDLQTYEVQEDMINSDIPEKYKSMGYFHEIIQKKLRLQCPCIAIGGNHENFKHVVAFQSGGHLAHNLFYAGTGKYEIVIDHQLIDVVAVSGISHTGVHDIPLRHEVFLSNTYMKANKAACCARQSLFNTLDLSQTRNAIYISHDWPCGITRLINKDLLVNKGHNFCDTTIGGPVSSRLFTSIRGQESVYLCSHMHWKVDQRVSFQEGPVSEQINWNFQSNNYRVRFLALGKVEHGETGCEIIDFQAKKVNFEDGIYCNGKMLGKFDLDREINIQLICKNGKWAYTGGLFSIELE